MEAWYNNHLAISNEPVKSLTLFSSNSYAPYIGGTINSDEVWLYFCPQYETNSCPTNYRLDISAEAGEKIYTSFALAVIDKNKEILNIGWYKSVYTLDGDSMEMTLDFSHLLNLEIQYPFTSIIKHIWTYKEYDGYECEDLDNYPNGQCTEVIDFKSI